MAKKEFLEIEHKFLLDAKFDHAPLIRQLKNLRPRSEKKLSVKDTYFELRSNKKVIVRHRLDKEQEQLTIKDKGGDNEIRREINLNLPKSKTEDQLDKIKVFLNMLDIRLKGIIEKKIHVFHFPQCEVVLYVGRELKGKKKVSCLEFEAHDYKTRKEALAIIADYERKLGFAARRRCKLSLYDLLIK